MSTAALTKYAAENAGLRKEVRVLQEKVAAFELKEKAEDLLLELSSSASGSELAPVGISDFIEKRANIVELGSIEKARHVVKLASRQTFGGIGELSDQEEGLSGNHGAVPKTDSQADDEFSKFLYTT